MNNLSAAEIAEQKEILVQNGTLCLKCGSLNEALVREDGSRVLKEAPSKVMTCDKCKGMGTGYEFDVVENNEVIYKSPLEDGFMPVEEEAKTVTIQQSKYGDLLGSAEKLSALEAAGVDNWEGYDIAMEILLGEL